MNPIDELLRHLSRPGVTELAMATGKAPAAKVAGVFRSLGPTALTTADIAAMLTQLGAPPANAYADKPAQWKHEAPQIGGVAVVAVQRADAIQVRISLAAATPAKAAVPVVVAADAKQLGGMSSSTEPTARMRPPPGGAAGGRPPASVVAESAQGSMSPAPTEVRSPSAAPVLSAVGQAVPLVSESMDAKQAPLSSESMATPSAPDPTSPPRAVHPPGRHTDFDTLLELARNEKASDLHLVAGRPPALRVVGELVSRGATLDPSQVEKLVMPQVPRRLLTVLERDGSCDFALDHPTFGRFRVNVGRQRTGLKASLRLIGREVPTLESLGLPEAIASATHHHQGLIIVSGPSGQGKTSTLAALVNLVNSHSAHHVITVEDPIEYLHPRKKAVMSQREVGSHTKSFQSALKGSLREDPDVIVVGELRDTETVRMAISAGETGHLMISTMNTPSAAKTIDRLIDLFPPAEQAQVRISISVGLRLIVSQRLMPNADRTGVVAAAEVLPGSVSLGNLIREEKTYQIPSLQQRGKSMGIVRFDDALADLVHTGKTTLETASQYAESPAELTSIVATLKNAAAAPAPPGKPGTPPGRKG